MTTEHRYAAEFVITRDGSEVHRGSWFCGGDAKSEPGFRCDHAVISTDEYDEGYEKCGWCESQGNDGTWRPCSVIWCPNCMDTLCLDDPSGGELSFVRHLTQECGL